jgi:hypothetical protein
MGRIVNLSGSDLEVDKNKNAGSIAGRGRFPSDDLVPLQFRMSAEFVKSFKQETLNMDLKLNELLELSFNHLTGGKGQ